MIYCSNVNQAATLSFTFSFTFELLFTRMALVWQHQIRKTKSPLSFVFNDYRSSYEDILNRNNLLSLKEQRYMKIIEFTYKALNGLLPSLNNIFSTKDCKYNFRDSHKLQLPRVNTITYGINSFKYLGSKLWNLLPPEIKSSETFEIFKEALKPTILFFIFTHNYIILCYLISQRK